MFGQQVQPVTELSGTEAKCLFVVAYDAERLIHQIRHVIPEGTKCISLDEARLPEAMLTNPTHYLASLNFATNFAFFRDRDGLHAGP